MHTREEASSEGKSKQRESDTNVVIVKEITKYRKQAKRSKRSHVESPKKQQKKRKDSIYEVDRIVDSKTKRRIAHVI
jgi:hypothetical protein